MSGDEDKAAANLCGVQDKAEAVGAFAVCFVGEKASF